MVIANERVALLHAVDKLAALGPLLPFPHQSDVRGAAGWRELRPRGGRGRVRGIYGRLEQVFVILAVGPEAQVDRRGFDRAVHAGVQRLDEITE